MVERAQGELDRFGACFSEAYLEVMRAKLGLDETHEDDLTLVSDLLECAGKAPADFTLLFRHLAGAQEDGPDAAPFLALFPEREAIDAWLVRYRARIGAEAGTSAERAERMRATNPLYIPRNHLVEEALAAAAQGDLAPFDAFMTVLERPYDEQDGRDRYTLPPTPDQVVRETFCGT